MQQECLLPSRHRHVALSTEMWKECKIPSQEKLLSDKWHCILLLLFMSSSFSYMRRVILAFWCTVPLKTLARPVWLNCPQLIASVNAPQLILQEALAHGPWAACRLGQHLLEKPKSCLLWPCAETVCFLIQVHLHVQSSRVPRLCEQLVIWYVWLP